MAAPPEREIRAGAASWPGASGLPFGFRVSGSSGLELGSLPVGNPAAWLPTSALSILRVGKLRLEGSDRIPDGERVAWMRGLARLWICGRLDFRGPRLSPPSAPLCRAR